MTWVPKNRPENDDDENSDKDADEKGKFHQNRPILPRKLHRLYHEFSQKQLFLSIIYFDIDGYIYGF